MFTHSPEMKRHVSEICIIPKPLQKPNLYSVHYEEEMNNYLQRCRSIRGHLEIIIKAIGCCFNDNGYDYVLDLKRKRFNESLTSIEREIEEMVSCFMILILFKHINTN